MRICAVVVTYNRMELLREALGALKSQTRLLDEIVVVNNASDDGTGEMLATEFQDLEVLSLDRNLGGAGGFHAGMAWAHEQDFNWMWMMDDDSIADSDALSKLLDTYNAFPEENRPVLLNGRAVWTDGDLNPMNIPRIDCSDTGRVLYAAEKGCVPLRYCSFVSVLLRADMIDRYGMPIADYFIWNDDIEFTARVLKKEFGVWVPASTVCHKTAQKYVTMADPRSARKYYSFRNRIWMLTRSPAWKIWERVRLAGSILVSIFQHVRQSGFSMEALTIMLRGVRDGLFTKPTK